MRHVFKGWGQLHYEYDPSLRDMKWSNICVDRWEDEFFMCLMEQFEISRDMLKALADPEDPVCDPNILYVYTFLLSNAW